MFRESNCCVFTNKMYLFYIMEFFETIEKIIVECPHCKGYIIISELNCCIFRHGVFKTTGEQIPPHSSKIECNEYVEKSLIYGCGKPFKVVNYNTDMNTCTIEICDYI